MRRPPPFSTTLFLLLPLFAGCLRTGVRTSPEPSLPGWVHVDGLTPRNIALRAVHGGGGSVFVAGEDQNVLRYDDNGWGSRPDLPGRDVYGVFLSPEGRLYAAGFYGIQCADVGPVFTCPRRTGTGLGMRGIGASDDRNAFAVGSGGAILRSDGSSWSPMESPTQSALTGVWASSPSSAFAVGWSGTILRYDGTRWQPMESGTRQRLNAVWGSGPTNVIAVGEEGTILRFDGERWALMTSPLPYGLNGIWGTSATDVYAVGASSSHGGFGGVILHYDGTVWRTLSDTLRSRAYGVFASPTAGVVVVGQDGLLLHLRP